MRIKLLTLCLALLPAACLHAATPAIAPAVPVLQADASAPPTCEGTFVIVRESEIKPGMMARFLEASALNLKWYRDKGITTNQMWVSRILERDANGGMAYSDTKVMSYHYNPPSMTNSLPKDEAYGTFVKMYQESSSKLLEVMTCQPKVKL